MSIEPYNRAERILSGEDLEPTTRLEYFMKEAASGGGGGGGSAVVYIRSAPGGYFVDYDAKIPVDKSISEILSGIDQTNLGFTKVFFVELPVVIFDEEPVYTSNGGKVVMLDELEKFYGQIVVGEIGNVEYRTKVEEDGLYIIATET